VHIQPVLIGRSESGEYQLSGAEWGSQTGGVYAYVQAEIPAGSQVEVVFKDGSSRILEVIGSYDIAWNVPLRGLENGLLMPVELFARLVQPDTVTYFVKSPPGKLSAVSADLGKTLPESTVINLAAYAARFTQTYHNLFVLALAMSGLALLAGVLLIANSVSLAMLDRRYEMGVLKAIGYSRIHILGVLAVEYGLVALLASLAGLAAVQIFIWVMGAINDLAGRLLAMEAVSAGLILLCGIGLVLATVVAVSWGQTRQPPSDILTDHG
jgi:putative ABC transport system permease protein